MPRDSLQIANELIKRASDAGSPISNLALQKLLYFSQGWYLALANERLIDDEFEAWRYGPVVPGVYHAFKIYLSNPIPEDHLLAHHKASLTENENNFLDKIWDVYGKLPPHQLVAISHDKDGPWRKVWDEDNSGQMNDDEIKKYFISLANK